MAGVARPRIFLDGYNLALLQGTGVATYARNLSFALGRLGAEVGVLYGTRSGPSADPLLREVAFFDDQVEEGRGWLGTVLRRAAGVVRAPFGEAAHPVPVTGQVITAGFAGQMPHFDELWNAQDLFKQSAVQRDFFGGRLKVRLARPPALMHWTYPLALQVPGATNVYTMHDLVPLRLPYTTLDKKRHYLRLVRMLGQQADHIVTVSEASRRDIVSLLGIPEERVTNTYQAVDIPAALRGAPLSTVRNEVGGSFGLEMGRYWLFFGAIEPKKNVGRLIQAYLASGVQDPLVIVGKKAWKSEDELRLMMGSDTRYFQQDGDTLRIRHKIMLLDYAPFRLLVGLIRGAKAVLFPSLYEGFGLPALEAMLLGTPVITSNTASMPEVVGDAALTVDPYNVLALVEAIQVVNRDPELRARLAAAGPVRAALFSPERYADRLRALYVNHGSKFS